jgi:hypothetical protein
MNSNTLNLKQGLIDATIKGDRPTVTELLSRGADVNAKDDNGQTALMVATYKGEVGLVHLLLEKGADPRIPDRDGWTAFKYAEQLQETAILELLGDADEVKTQVSAAAATELETFTPTARTAVQGRSGAESFAAKDWRDAVSLGTLIGGSIMILIILLVKPQAPQTAVTNSVSSGSSDSAASSNSSSVTSTNTITEAQAVNLISTWFKSKEKIFAPPFDRQLAAELTTGVLYYDITKPGGSIDWLRSENAFYRFGVRKVEPTGLFAANGDQATIEVVVTEELSLYVNGKQDNTQSGFNTRRVRYSLKFVNNKWKIEDYKKLN